MHLLRFLLVLGITLALPPARGIGGTPTPGSFPVHRHLLPGTSLPQVLAKGEIEVLSWADLDRLLQEGAAAREKPPTRPGSGEAPGLAFESLGVRVVQEAADRDLAVYLDATAMVPEGGWRTVPLLDSKATTESFSATRDGAPTDEAYLVTTGAAHAALLEGAGTWRFRLKAWVPVTRNGHLRKVSLRVPPVAGAVGRAELAGENLEVFMDPAPQTVVEGVGDGKTRTRAPLPPGEPFEVQWFPRDAGLETRPDDGGDAAPPPEDGLAREETRTYARWSEDVVLGHAGLEGRLVLRVDVYRAPVTGLKVRLEGAHENLEVDPDPGLIESVRPVEGGVDLLFKGSRQGALRVGFRFRYRDPAGDPSFTVRVPRPRLVGAFSERTDLRIGRSTNVSITPKLSGVVSPAPADSGAAGFDSLLQYRLEDESGQVDLAVKRYPDAPGIATRVVDRLEARTTLAAGGRAHTRVEIQIRDRKGAPLKLRLPAGSTPVAFFRDSRRIHPVIAGDEVTLPLLDETRGAPREEVRLRAEWIRRHPGGPLENFGQRRLELARVDAPVMQLEWTVTAPDGYRLTGETQPKPAGQLSVTRRLIQPDGDQAALRLRLGYRSWKARELIRFGKLLLGLAEAWLLCALLVGRAPLSWGLALLFLWGLHGPVGLFGSLRDPLASGMASGLAIGLLVGVRRGVAGLFAGRRRRREERAARARAMTGLRARLGAAARGEPEEPPGGPREPEDAPGSLPGSAGSDPKEKTIPPDSGGSAGPATGPPKKPKKRGRKGRR